MVTHGFLPAQNKALYFTRYFSEESKTGVLFLYPIWNDRSRFVSSFHTAAKALVYSNVDSIIFDYFAQGNSPGSESALSYQSIKDDINSAKNAFFGNHYQSFFVIVGGLAWAFCHDLECTKIMLVDPEISIAKYFNALIREQRTKEIVAFGKSKISSDILIDANENAVHELCEFELAIRVYKALKDRTIAELDQKDYSLIVTSKPGRDILTNPSLSKRLIDLSQGTVRTAKSEQDPEREDTRHNKIAEALRNLIVSGN